MNSSKKGGGNKKREVERSLKIPCCRLKLRTNTLEIAVTIVQKLIIYQLIKSIIILILTFSF